MRLSRKLHVTAAVLVSTPYALAFPSNQSPTIGSGTKSIPGVECGSLQVPLDYSGHDRGTVELGFTRLKTISSKRLGTLIYNPGGPGESGSFQVAAQHLGLFSAISDAAIEHYDIIGYDPRGVGMSTPIKCDPNIWNQRVSSVPTTEDAFNALIAKNQAFGESCANLTGPLINHVDTTHVARDLESIRVALDDGKLNFIALSYGTQIASQYVELFPENVGRFVLDSIVDHSQSEVSSFLAEATTAEVTMNEWFKWCNTTEDCALHGLDAASIYEKVVSATPEAAIPAPGCVDTGVCRESVWGEEILFHIQKWLGVKEPMNGAAESWAGLSQALFEASNGNATLFSSALASGELDSTFPAIAVLCQDWRHNSNSLEDISLRTTTAKLFAPHTRGLCQSYTAQVACMGWPAPLSNPQHTLDPEKTSKSPPMLLTNPLYDPATSLAWARGLKEQLPGSTLLIRDGVGHTSYILGGETTAIVDAYLVNGTLPLNGTITQS